jgi:4-hydroxy-tetrahydrodipicolinate reductase
MSGLEIFSRLRDMGDLIRVLILGTGQMGSGMARYVLDAPGLELAGAYGKRRERAGTDLGRAIGLDRELGIAIDSDLAMAVKRAQPHVALQATCSRLEDAWPEIAILLREGVSVISIAEEMAYPAFRSPAIAAEMADLARANGAAVVGTGINPGFVLDLLVVALTGVCSSIEAITATRVNDLSPYGPTVLEAQGVGITPEAFETGLTDGTVTGHFGFPQSISMIASALGRTVQRIEQTVAPIVSEVRRETPFVTVEPGHVAGTRHTAVGYLDDAPFITLVHPQQVGPELAGVETGDSIEIVGQPSLRLSGRPEIPGDAATVAIAVNMIPRILAASPGLHTMIELPVPAALLGGARRQAERHAGEPVHG